MRNKFQQRGFTLIELLVVIVILGILSTISVGTFRSYFAKARDSERVSTVQNVAMMIKVDSGGSGDCGVYNYIDGGKTYAGGSTDCAHEGVLGTLLTANDYSMPISKNGLEYFYGFNLGSTEGNNEFFIVIGAEEAVPQNGKELGSTGEYVFVDGTTTGIDAITANAGGADGCTWNSTTKRAACGTDWQVYQINADGKLGTGTITNGLGTAETAL